MSPEEKVQAVHLLVATLLAPGLEAMFGADAAETKFLLLVATPEEQSSEEKGVVAVANCCFHCQAHIASRLLERLIAMGANPDEPHSHEEQAPERKH